MSRVSSATNRILPRSLSRGPFNLLVLLAVAASPAAPLRPDAYLSRDKVHYGADSYTVDYDREVIQANGNAFFRKGNRSLFAGRVVIEYGKGKKRAFFYDRVRLENKDDQYTIDGDEAQAQFESETYRVEGNARFTDSSRAIESKVIEVRAGEGIRFNGGVRYEDEDYIVTAPDLFVGRDTALFDNGVEAVRRNGGDRVLCDSVTFWPRTGDVLFEGGVYYAFDKVDGGEGAASAGLILKADAIRYLREQDTLVLSGQPYLLRGDLSLSAATVEYDRKRDRVSAMGGAVLREGRKAMYSVRLELDVKAGTAIFYEEARGIFPSREP